MEATRTANELQGQPDTAPQRPALVWEVIDDRGHPSASFYDAAEAFKFARYGLHRPGQAQAAIL